jgi:hypothetical protein
VKFGIEWNCFDLSTVLQKSTGSQTHTNKTKTIKKEAIPF